VSDPITIGYVDNWIERLKKTRLYVQFRDKTTHQMWCEVLGQQAQDAEDAVQTLNDLLNIDVAEGVQLDVIGRIVGQPRLGLDDATYRTTIRARIQTNASDGSPEDIYPVIRALFPEYSAFTYLVITTSNIGVKAFSLRIDATISRAAALRALSFLSDAKEAGARGLLKWRSQTSATTFTYGGTFAQSYGNGKYAGEKQA
jgi:hypothetical protein